MSRSATKYSQIVVDSSKRTGFRSLVSAIESVIDGGTIYLKPGNYVLKGNISKSITINGCGSKADEVVVTIPFSEPVTIKSARFEMHNVALQSSRSECRYDPRHFDKPLVTLAETVVFKNTYCEWSHINGIAIVASKSATIECVHTYFGSCEEGAVVLEKETKGIFEQCVFSGYYTMAVKFSGRSLALNTCHFTDHWVECVIDRDAEVVVQGCEFTRNDASALKVTGAGQLIVRESRFFENRGDALSIAEKIQSRISQCCFTENEDTGLLIMGEVDAQIEDCIFRNNDRGLLINSKVAACITRCQFEDNESIGVHLCDGQIQLNQCNFASKSIIGHKELAHIGYNSEVLTPDLHELPVGLKVSGENINLMARKCTWQLQDSVEINDTARGTFIECHFDQLLRGVIVSDAYARFLSCKFDGARYAALCLRNNGIAEVDHCEITKALYGVVVGQNGILNIENSQIFSIDLTGVFGAANTKTTAISCSFEDIQQNAVEMLGEATVFASKCRFSKAGSALKIQGFASFRANSCDFRETVHRGKLKKSKGASVNSGQVWIQELAPSALNQIEKHIKFENCRFPVF